MTVKRKQHSAQFKFEVALAATKNAQTVNQIAGEHQLHPSQVSQWKNHLFSTGPEIFKTSHSARQQRQQQEREAKLYKQIGRLQMELAWLKKNYPSRLLSIRRQCDLVGLNRASYYYQPAQESNLNLNLMRLIDAQYTKNAFLWLA